MTDPLEELRAAAREALPPYEGELEVPGLRGRVEVLRDGWGIPYLSAGSLEDLWFAQGFVQASERLFQIELALRVAGGRLAGRSASRQSETRQASRAGAAPGGSPRMSSQ